MEHMYLYEPANRCSKFIWSQIKTRTENLLISQSAVREAGGRERIIGKKAAEFDERRRRGRQRRRRRRGRCVPHPTSTWDTPIKIR